MQIRIRNEQGRYLAPKSVSGKHPNGVRGFVGLRKTAYRWIVEKVPGDDVYTISTPDGLTWDFWDNPPPVGQPIYLWHHKNSGDTQRFSVSDSSIGMNVQVKGNGALRLSKSPMRLLIEGLETDSSPVGDSPVVMRFMTYNILVPDEHIENGLSSSRKYRNWSHPSGHRRGLVTEAASDLEVFVFAQIQRSKRIESPDFVISHV